MGDRRYVFPRVGDDLAAIAVREVGVETVVVNGEVTWSADRGYVTDARAGCIATRP